MYFVIHDILAVTYPPYLHYGSPVDQCCLNIAKCVARFWTKLFS